MKKILLFSALMMILQMPVSSAYYIEGNGMYGTFGDADIKMMFGGGVGMNVLPMFNAYLKFQNGSASNKVDGIETSHYKQTAVYAEGEYMYRIGKFPLLWCAWAGIGMSKFNMWEGAYNEETGKKIGTDITGLYMTASTGLRYHLSQHVGIYSRVGYHTSKWIQQTRMKNPAVAGISVQIGVTATIFGMNSNIDDEY